MMFLASNTCFIMQSIRIFIFLILVLKPLKCQEQFKLSFIHINDFHAKFAPVSVTTGSCKPGNNELGQCYGGISRIATAIRELQETLPNSVLLNAGDSFQGSLLYSLFKWNITVELMNRIPFDATALGNHEFDDGVAGIVPYMEGLKSPIVAANIDASLVPQLQGKFKKSIVIEKDNRSIGIIGCITKYTNELSKSEDVIFLDEMETVAAEAAHLKSQGVDIIVLLSHSGYMVDHILAQNITDLDVIVGAHSHTFLYTADELPSTEVPEGKYPTVITQSSGRKVLIVQAYAYSKYVGALQVNFDDNGEVVSWTGAPKLLDSTVAEDPEMKEALQPWLDEANILGEVTLGTTAVTLLHSHCYQGECNLGNFLTDAMVAQHVDVNLAEGWTTVALAIMNPGGLRASLGESPNITFNDLATSQPFANSIDVIELQGKDIKELLEISASKYWSSLREFKRGRGSMQVSGMKVLYKLIPMNGVRVLDLQLRCARCRVPMYKPVDLEEWYSVAMPSFLSNGGGGFALIPERGRNKIVGLTDVDVFSKYITAQSPIIQGIEGRNKVII